MATEQAIRNVSDTAIWAALYRARETEREKALFRDQFARRLAGQRGDRIAETMRKHDEHEWAWVMRTVLFDRFISGEIAEGADMVVNLASGLDARPFRMALPPSLQWIEVDLPDLLEYKEQILQNEKPACALDSVRLNLAGRAARRELFRKLGETSKNALIITEGLLIYLDEAEVGELASDLAEPGSFRHWVLDIASPGLLRLLQSEVGSELDRAHAPLQFAPAECAPFFTRYGWRPAAVRSPLKEAAREKRLSLLRRLIALLLRCYGSRGARLAR